MNQFIEDIWTTRFNVREKDEGHLRNVNAVPEGADFFFSKSTFFLKQHHRPILEYAYAHLEELPAKWNPLGFIVWQLGVDYSGHSLRLHVWPKNNRKITTRPPGIHCHAWYLTSMMLMGSYVDKHFNIIEHGYFTEVERKHKGFFRKFSLTYFPDGTTSLINRGECVEIELRNVVVAREYTIQSIKDGIFHAPDVPQDQDVVTLVIDSAQLGYPTTAILDSDQTFPTRGREAVSDAEIIHTRTLIEEILEKSKKFKI